MKLCEDCRMIAKQPENNTPFVTKSQQCTICGEIKPLSAEFWLPQAHGYWFPECLSCVDRTISLRNHSRGRNYPSHSKSQLQDTAHYTQYFSVGGITRDRQFAD